VAGMLPTRPGIRGFTAVSGGLRVAGTFPTRPGIRGFTAAAIPDCRLLTSEQSRKNHHFHTK